MKKMKYGRGKVRKLKKKKTHPRNKIKIENSDC